MFKFHIFQHVPEFILRDKNGCALARAIEAAIKYLNEHADTGFNIITDVDQMPEWRLDECAWELNCLYEYNGTIAQKRKWIREARPMYRIWGTKEALQKYLDGYFENVEVEENWYYNGDPYHFRIFVEGTWNPETEAWTIKAVEKAKNVRSVLDDIAIGCISYLGLTGEGVVLAKFPYPLANQYKSGEWPQENYRGIIDNSGIIGIRDDTKAFKFPYDQTGVSPDVNIIGVLDLGGRAAISAEVKEKGFDYYMTDDAGEVGTRPQESYVGTVDNSGRLGIEDSTEHHKFPYDQAGTSPDVNVESVIDESGKAAVTGDAKSKAFAYHLANDSDRSGTEPQTSEVGVLADNNIQSAQADDFYMTIYYRMCGQDEI